MDVSVTTALIAFGGVIIASGGTTAIVQHLLNKKSAMSKKLDDLDKKIEKVDKKVDKLDEKQDQSEAVQARARILLFADEMYNNVRHSREHFMNVLEDIDMYNRYCNEHPKFLNQKTVNAQRRINEVFDECEKTHSFLDSKEDE